MGELEWLLGMPMTVFLGFTVIITGSAAWLSGRALAAGWRPAWVLLPTAAGLALADRFFVWALFGGAFFPVPGTLAEFATLLGIALAAHRHTRARRMVQQYPWLYERRGPFGWRRLPPERSPRRPAGIPDPD